MTSKERCELLKETIQQLYSQEGRSKSYIAKTLRINRKVLTEKIAEWSLPTAEPRRHASPKTKKWLSRHKTQLLSMLRTDMSETKIATSLGVDRGFITRTLTATDQDVDAAVKNHRLSYHTNADRKRQVRMTNSSRIYDFEELDGEEWKPILGHECYEISNMGRMRKWADTYKAHYLIPARFNPVVGRWYVSVNDGNKPKQLSLARVVAFAFCEGHSNTRNTVNHKNGDVNDNRAENLEWLSQSENNKHSYRELNRRKVRVNKAPFQKVIYRGTYEFKTVSALARFIGKSETQTRRYLEEPERHDMVIVPRTK